MAGTDPQADPYRRKSMFVVPAETPGIEILRNVTVMHNREELDEGTHVYMGYHNVRVPADATLGGPGEGFTVAQARLVGGGVHHAIRTVASVAKDVLKDYSPTSGLFPPNTFPLAAQLPPRVMRRCSPSTRSRDDRPLRSVRQDRAHHRRQPRTQA